MTGKFWQRRPVVVVRTLSGWTTIRLTDGTEKKVRNSQLSEVTARVGVPKNWKLHKCTDIGEETAELLRGKSLDEVYRIAAQRLGEDEHELRARYAHCNPGSQKMSISNRIRHARAAARA
jgi:hypothetical protein